MNNLKKALDNLKYDNRMVDLNIQNGVVSNQEYHQYLGQLEDLSGRCESLELESSNKEESVRESHANSNGYAHEGGFHQ